MPVWDLTTLERSSGKTSTLAAQAGIAVPSKDKLVGVIQTMVAAVRAGELDDILAQQGRARSAPKAKRAA